jgi:signal transduction histidine kinase
MIKPMKRPIEPALMYLFRYFCAIASVYFAILWLYAVISAGWMWQAQLQFFSSFIFYLLLLGYLSWTWLENHLKRFFLPFGLAIATVYPVLSSSISQFIQAENELLMIISRSWLWMPVLLIPLVLIAWQYSFQSVLVFIIFTNLPELIVLLLVVDKLTFETMPLVSVPFIRAFAFGMVGHIVNNLVDTQRAQRRRLIQANVRLGQYTNTLEQLATSRERNRLASELHDTLAHTLSGLAVNLEAIKTVVPPAELEAQEMLDRALYTTRTGLDETRRALKALRAGPLEDLGLSLAMQMLVNGAAERANISVTFDCPQPAPALPVDVEQNLYRITQEALENIVRHANASHAMVKLAGAGGGVKLTICDDGSGFDPSKSGSDNRFGLRGLRERASLLGGRLDVTSQPGNGTEICFIWEPEHDKSTDL